MPRRAANREAQDARKRQREGAAKGRRIARERRIAVRRSLAVSAVRLTEQQKHAVRQQFISDATALMPLAWDFIRSVLDDSARDHDARLDADGVVVASRPNKYVVSDERWLELKHKVIESLLDRMGVPRSTAASLSIAGAGAPVLVRVEGGLGWPQAEERGGAVGGGADDARSGGGGTGD